MGQFERRNKQKQGNLLGNYCRNLDKGLDDNLKESGGGKEKQTGSIQ